MPVMSGSEATRIIKSHYPGVKIVALTTFYDADIIDEAMNAGCDGFLLKTISPEQLKASLVSVLNGISIIDTDALEQLRKRKNAKTSVEFNGRELEMLGYICKGLSNKEIAEKLSLQPGTVKNMVSLLLNKTYCISRADLTRYAIEHKLV